MNNNEDLKEQNTGEETPILTPVEGNLETEVLTPEVSQNENVMDNSKATEIVQQVEKQAALATEVYENKETPVAPQQDRVQLIDDKPKLHAVQFNGAAVSTENKAEQDNTEVLEVVENKDVSSNNDSGNNKNGKSHTFGLIVLFGGLFLLVIFLPDISQYISTQKYLKNQQIEEKITTGTLSCVLNDSSETLDYNYKVDIDFNDSLVTKMISTTEIRGDVSLDEAELDNLKTECDLLVSYTDNLKGVSVSCKLVNGLLTKRQTFNFSTIIVDDAITAFIEAGGSYPSYDTKSNIDDVEKDLNSSNYECERLR